MEKNLHKLESTDSTRKRLSDNQSSKPAVERRRIRLNEEGKHLTEQENYVKYKEISSTQSETLTCLIDTYKEILDFFKKYKIEPPKQLKDYYCNYENKGVWDKENRNKMVSLSKDLIDTLECEAEDKKDVKAVISQFSALGGQLQHLRQQLKDNYTSLEKEIKNHNEQVKKHNDENPAYQAKLIDLNDNFPKEISDQFEELKITNAERETQEVQKNTSDKQVTKPALELERIRLNEEGKHLTEQKDYIEYEKSSKELGTALLQSEEIYGDLLATFDEHYDLPFPEEIDRIYSFEIIRYAEGTNDPHLENRERLNHLVKLSKDKIHQSLHQRDTDAANQSLHQRDTDAANQDIDILATLQLQIGYLRYKLEKRYIDLEEQIGHHNEKVKKHNEKTQFYRADRIKSWGEISDETEYAETRERFPSIADLANKVARLMSDDFIRLYPD